MNNLFNEICKKFKLGALNDYKEIIGGLTNKLYKITTSTSEYAIKILNLDKLKEQS